MAEVQSSLKGPGSFGGFNAQTCILAHSRDSSLLFMTASSTPKTDKNSTLCNGFEITFILEKHMVEDNVLFTNHLVGK